jgi:hypothetical protein
VSKKTWVPNRKIVAAAVAGLVALLYFILTGTEIDPNLQSAIVGGVMILLGYLVPLKEDDKEDEGPGV